MIRLLLTLLICVISLPAIAEEKLDYSTFEQFPVLDNGRIKPLGAYAKIKLKDFYKSDQFGNIPASQWFAETLFNPAEAASAKIFTIEDDALKTRLGLDTNKKHFNFQDLQAGLEDTKDDVANLLQSKQQDELTAEQKDLIHVHENAFTYTELLRSFSLILPLENNTTFDTLAPKEQRIVAQLKEIIADKGTDINVYTAAEQKIALEAFQLRQIRAGAAGNDDLKVIPSSLNNEQTWIAPWQIINEGKGSPKTSQLLEQWKELATAYRNNDAQKWDEASKELLTQTLSEANGQAVKTRLSLELVYQDVQPYHIAMGFYLIGIILLIISLSKPNKLIQTATWLSLVIATLSHTFGIAARTYILDRPPVGTLYESVIFVSLICAFVALIAYTINRKPALPLVGQIAALSILAIAPVMLQGNDSLELLVAVLNTNFWLTTHVLCITIGYGICILAACLAHAYMALRIKNPSHPQLGNIFQSIHKISLTALLFTAVGTVLGGIWADQSWGRFWGWDPKENGALLIVLWLIWLQHGRLSGNLRPLSYVAGIAALNVIVALSWFGVNLLGVGLHSYGFTSGLATGLTAFCTLQTAIIIGFWFTIRHKQKTLKA